jgi:hypothetical protein
VTQAEITIQVSNDERLIAVKLSGSPRPDAIVKMLGDLNALVERDPTLRILIDEMDLSPSFVGPGDIGRFVEAWRNGTALRSARMAVFVANLAMYGLNRMFEALANADGRIAVFYDRAHATAWLNEAQFTG